MASRRRERFVERRKTLGLSQEGLAEAIGVETSTVARWERGETTPQPWHRPRLAEALKVSAEEVAGLLASGQAAPTDQELPAPARSSGDGHAAHLHAWGALRTLEELGVFLRSDMLNRRDILAASVAAATGKTLVEPLARWFDSEPASLPASVPAPIDPAIVDHLAALRAVLVDSDNQLGAAWVLPSVRHQLAMIAQFRRQARGQLHTQLLSAESRWAEFAGWLSDDLGDHGDGASWLSQSMSMAQEANDLDFSAFLFARMAQRTATSSDDDDRALGLAHAATRVGTTRSHVRAFATLQRAYGFAIAGETREFESAIDEARALVGQDPAPPGDLGSFCTVAYVLAQEAEGWLRLGRPNAAAQRFGDALAMWPASYRRDRGLYLSRAAAAHLADQQPDEAATLGLEALELADVTRSSRVGRQVLALGRQLRKFGDRPATARLLAALDEAATATS